LSRSPKSPNGCAHQPLDQALDQNWKNRVFASAPSGIFDNQHSVLEANPVSSRKFFPPQ
jgi:hypothetical protein